MSEVANSVAQKAVQRAVLTVGSKASQTAGRWVWSLVLDSADQKAAKTVVWMDVHSALRSVASWVAKTAVWKAVWKAALKAGSKASYWAFLMADKMAACWVCWMVFLQAGHWAALKAA